MLSTQSYKSHALLLPNDKGQIKASSLLANRFTDFVYLLAPSEGHEMDWKNHKVLLEWTFSDIQRFEKREQTSLCWKNTSEAKECGDTMSRIIWVGFKWAKILPFWNGL